MKVLRFVSEFLKLALIVAIFGIVGAILGSPL